MKIENNARPFNPITITLETEEEATFFFALFNFTPICNIADGYLSLSSYDIRKKLGEGWDYSKVHARLCEINR